nr:ankyrin repeat domain-containing protein SOWAHA-like [Gasterosteus aculeatus aculeatus]
MALTQESVLSLLIAEGGGVKKSDLVSKFKGSIDCADPAEKKRNRELFKTLVNNVAIVKEIDGVQYVVLRKTQPRAPNGARTAEEPGGAEVPGTGEHRRSPTAGERSGSCDDARTRDRSAVSEPEAVKESGQDPAELLTPIDVMLQRAKYPSVRVKRMMNFEIQRQGPAHGDNSSKGTVAKSKPYALPLRMPPCSTTAVEIRKLKADPPGCPEPDSSRSKRCPPPVEASASSPQMRRAVKVTKESEEPKETSAPSLYPMEQSEHQWLVKCAAGHWRHVLGLLLKDHRLAEKRDFMSGFTALHWAAKCGNREMLVKIVDLSRQGGGNVDVNVKTHGGYTPLHIAALHGQEHIMAILVGELGANPGVRDNCGKRAHHYLRESTSETLSEMLGKPKAPEAEDRAQHDKEEPDLFTELPKGLNSIARLFQPHTTGIKKRQKQWPGFLSASDEAGEDREDGSCRRRIVSEAFM